MWNDVTHDWKEHSWGFEPITLRSEILHSIRWPINNTPEEPVVSYSKDLPAECNIFKYWQKKPKKQQTFKTSLENFNQWLCYCNHLSKWIKVRFFPSQFHVTFFTWLIGIFIENIKCIRIGEKLCYDCQRYIRSQQTKPSSDASQINKLPLIMYWYNLHTLEKTHLLFKWLWSIVWCHNLAHT